MNNVYVMICAGTILLATGYLIGRLTTRKSKDPLKYAGDLIIDVSSYGVEDMYASWNSDLMPLTKENEVLLKVIVHKQ